MVITLEDETILKNAEKATSHYALCDHCLGLLYAKINPGITNKERGKTLRSHLHHSKEILSSQCWLCEGLFDEIPHFTMLIEKALNNYEYTTFLIGSRLDEDILQREQKLIDETETPYAESLKNALNREIGLLLADKLGKNVDFEHPDIMVILDTTFDTVSLQIKSLYIYGRYRKLSRDIPQTKWFCRICKGRGCRKCSYSGKLYDTSVEEIIAHVLLHYAKGDDGAFHGCGREDIDVRMLGNGRPFVFEIKNPKIRTLPLPQIETEISKQSKGTVTVHNLRYSTKEEIIRIKNARFNKVYQVLIECKKPVNKEKLKKAAQALQGTTIQQFTPTRVAHRRAHMVRAKKIYSCNIDIIEKNMVTLTIEAESGTYIKELISGDNGNTKPSFSDLTGTPCSVIELDVMEIKGE